MYVDIIFRLIGLVMLGAIPILTVLAYINWNKCLRRELPRWRNMIGVTSIVITLFSWAYAVGVVTMIMLDYRLGSWATAWSDVVTAISVCGGFAALALKGTSRIQAFVAALLLAVGLMIRVS